MDLTAEFDKRKPWTTQYVIDGKTYGDGQFDFSSDPRISLFFNQFQHISSILELGSLEGGHTFGLARHPGVTRVVGVEGRAESCEKARFVQRVLHVPNVQFCNANLEHFKLSTLGQFDAVFCVGLLYHLPAPWKLLGQIARCSSRLFIWTHFAEQGDTKVNGYEGIWYQEQGLKDPLSGMSGMSFWPTLEALKQMLTDSRYDEIDVVDQNISHPHGPEVTLAASSCRDQQPRLLRKIGRRLGF